jgi:diguanylate cyclase (GGDEF)-like protein/putative nucleotidyltransferase with HDIG domain
MGQFLFYLAAGILCSKMKLRLPGITGTLSMSYVVTLVGVMELGFPQAIAISCAGGVGQLFWSAKKRPRAVQVLFTLSSLAVSSGLTYLVFHGPALQSVMSSFSFRLFNACVVSFLTNAAMVGAIIAWTEGKRMRQVWNDDLIWIAPAYLTGGIVAAGVHAANGFIGWQSGVLLLPVVYLLYRSFHLDIDRLEGEKLHASNMAALHLRTVEALTLAVDAKDGNTHDHLRRVQVYAREIGRELALSEEERLALEAASLLHDIGKLAVPDHIISKPGKLTQEEFEKMKVHPIVGAEILESVRFPYPVAPLVRAHHEKWNGTGYPDGLKGEEIPIGARILGAVDCLDALASHRQYRRALPLEEALAIIVSESGVSYDPRVVEVLQRRCQDLERMAKAETSEHAAKLSTDVHVVRGGAPDAGLAEAAAPTPTAGRPDFIAKIAAARQEFQMLFELTRDLGSSLSVEEIMALLAARLKGVIPYTGIAIYTKKGSKLVTQYAAGDDAALFSSLQIPLGEGLSGWVVNTERPILNGNPSVEPGYLNDPARFSTLRSAISVPLPGTSGVVGALTLYHSDKDAFTHDQLRILLAVSSKAGQTIDNALRYVQVENTAVTDALTGLPNARSLFLQLDSEVALARQTGRSLAVLVLDMDGFKHVNDRFGHIVGNRVLQLTAQVLHKACPECHYAARMGGDEFVLLLPETGANTFSERIRRINDHVRAISWQVCHADVLGMSGGAACYPSDGADAEQLLAKADSRMYEMKRTRSAGAPSERTSATPPTAAPARLRTMPAETPAIALPA